MTSRDGPDPRRWRALAVTQVAGFMGLLDVSIVNVALPSIQRGLGASPAQIQWVVSGYALAFGVVLVAAGRLGDALGRRRLFLAALAAFVVTSALCGAAPNAELLVAARLAQGVAAGFLGPQNSGLIQDLFRGAERGRAFGLFGASVGLSTAAGPVVGGVILSLGGGSPDSWRWIFLVNVPIGLVALVLAARLLPASGGSRGGLSPSVLRELDVVGALLLGLGVLCFLLPVVQADAGGLRRLWWLFVVSAVLVAGFVRWEYWIARRGRAPLLDPVLVTGTAGYPAGAAIGLTYFIGFSGLWLAFALYFQDGLGYTPLQSGLAVTPYALGGAVAAAVAGRLVARFGRMVTVAGLTMVLVGFLSAAAVLLLGGGGRAAGWAVALPLLVAGVGGGAVISPNITLTLESVPVRMAGAAGGALQTGQRIGSAIGTALLAAVFYGVHGSSGAHYPLAIAVTLMVAAALVLLALALALLELRARRRRARASTAAPSPLAEVPD